MYPWLEPIYQQIAQAYAQGHGHHALLFRAENGLGVEKTFLKLTALLLCQNADSVAQGEACGHCHSCRLVQAGNHPDFQQIAPIEGKDIGVDQIRAMNEQVAQHAQQNGNKVVYIEGVERLTEAAANAILKTLEEPRPQTYFLLQADIAAPLLATIYSRCQVWNLPVPETQQACARRARATSSSFRKSARTSPRKPCFRASPPPQP